MPPSPLLARLARAARRTERRLRVVAALRVALVGLLPTLGVLAVRIAYLKLTYDRHNGWDRLLLGLIFLSAACTVAAVTWALLRPLPWLTGARRLDRVHDLHDRVSNALTFARRPAGERTPLMNAAIDDALAFVETLSPQKAVPLRWPRHGLIVVALGLAVVALRRLPARSRPIVVQTTAPIDAVPLSADDLEPFREAAETLARQDPSPEVQAVLERFNQLVEDLSRQRIDRDEAMRRLADLEEALRREQSTDRHALEEAWRQRADGLKKSPLTKSAAEALAKKDLSGASQALRDLAKRLRDPASKLSAEDKKRLREALTAATKQQPDTLRKLRERRDELRASLLQREQKATPPLPPSDEERRLLQRDQRELDRLDRELAQKERIGRQLERLDRDLAQAAADLMRELGQSADDLERGAEDLNRMGREELSEKEKEELRQAIQELREMLRQQGQGGEQLRKRLRKFAKKARGAGSERSGVPKPDGAGNDGEDEGEESKSGKDGKKGFVLRPGRAGGNGAGPGQKGAGSGPPKTPGGQGQAPGGNGWGTGHEGNVAGDETKPAEAFGTHDVQADAADTGQGPSVSETIAGASQRGFVGRGYRKVYTDYRTQAEATMKNETIPPGYRFYVRRYFQLIRPREGE